MEQFTKRAVFVAVAAVIAYRKVGSADYADFRSSEIVRANFEQSRDNEDDDENARRIARRRLPLQDLEDAPRHEPPKNLC